MSRARTFSHRRSVTPTRAFIARVGLTANTPYEAVYWGNKSDSEGHRMTGNSKYEMHFEQAIPYIEPGFWSVTLYDAENNYTVANPINRYMLGSDTPLKKNPDGSFTIYVQSDNPGPDKESNWLPQHPDACSISFRALTRRHKQRSISCPTRSRGQCPRSYWSNNRMGFIPNRTNMAVVELTARRATRACLQH
jgi:hypothetical protein